MVLALLMMIASGAALLFGVLLTLLCLSPGTDMADAEVIIRIAPLYAVSGLIGLLLGRWLWRTKHSA